MTINECSKRNCIKPINEYVKNDAAHWKIKFLLELYAKDQKKSMQAQDHWISLS